MRDEQRPWLKATPNIAGPLDNENGTLSIKIGIDMVNIAHRPAVNVRARAELVRFAKIMKIDKIKDLLADVCDSAPEDLWSFFHIASGSHIVFPDATERIDTFAVDAGGKKDFVKIMKTEPPEQLAVPVLDEIVLVFCVAYKAIRVDTIRHTGGTMLIKVPEGTGKIAEGQGIPVGSLRLERPPTFEWHNLAD